MNREHRKRTNGTGIYERRKALDSIKTLMKKNPSKAKAELHHHLDAYPDDMYAWFYYGEIMQDDNQLDEAEIAYMKVAESTSRNKYAGIVGLGEVARMRGQRELAKKYYRQAIRENPGEGTYTSYALARLERLDENYDEALRVLNMLPKSNETEIEKVKVLSVQGREAEALIIIKGITPENQFQARAIAFERAKMAREAGRIDEAKYYFLEAKECRVKDLGYYRIIHEEARMALETGEYQLAVDNCEEAYAAGAYFHGNTNFILGRAKQALGQYQSALTNYRMSAEMEDAPISTRIACYYYLGYLELVMGDLVNAEKDFRACLVSGDVLSRAAIDFLSGIYIKQGKYEMAEKFIAEIDEKYPNIVDGGQVSLVSLIIDKKLGRELPKRNLAVYRERQIIAYSRNEAIAHIKTRHQGSETESGVFYPSIDIEQLYENIRCQLTEENKAASDVMDRYFIDYPNVGYGPNGEAIHRVGVVAIPGTADIITMYPDIENSELRKKDVVKASSQQKNMVSDNRISRFNARFSKFTGNNN